MSLENTKLLQDEKGGRNYVAELAHAHWAAACHRSLSKAGEQMELARGVHWIVLYIPSLTIPLGISAAVLDAGAERPAI